MEVFSRKQYASIKAFHISYSMLHTTISTQPFAREKQYRIIGYGMTSCAKMTRRPRFGCKLKSYRDLFGLNFTSIALAISKNVLGGRNPEGR